MNKCLKYSIVISALGFSFQCAAQGAQLTSQLDKVCQSKEQKIEDVYENGALTQCYFKGSSLLSAYTKYRDLLKSDDKQFLIEQITINKNVEMKCKDDNCISVNYHWRGAKQLDIAQQFSGGETVLKFVQEDHGTNIEIRYFPD